MAPVNGNENTVSIAVFCLKLSVVRDSHFTDALVQNTPDTAYAREKAGSLGGNADFINNGVHVLRILWHPLNQVIFGYTQWQPMNSDCGEFLAEAMHDHLMIYHILESALSANAWAVRFWKQ